MSNIVPYQHEYRPLQVAPPVVPSHLIQPLVQPLVQQPSAIPQQQLQVQPRSTQPSPHPNEFGQSTNSAPFPGMAYSPHPPSPFDWMVSSITSLLHSQHTTLLAKFNEHSEQHLALVSRVEALQQSTDTLQRTVNTILDNVQQVSDKVAKLGADMASRDATLAERLNALDDAIEAWPTDAKPSGPTSEAPPVRELQTPPGSDGSVAQPSSQDTPDQDQLQSLNKLIQDADSLDGNNDLVQPKPSDSNGSSSCSLASLISPHPPSTQKGASSLASLVQKNTKAPKTPAVGRARIITRMSTGGSVRRSSRPSKKRQRNDGTIEASISKKKAKIVTKPAPKTEAQVGGKAPRKSSVSQFDWQRVPIQDEELEQLIYCDKCDQPYHWGCVNILPDDPILLADDTTWSCPPCEYEDQHGAIPGRTHDPDAKCRPDCPVQDHADDMFAIDAIIGRFPHSADPSGVMMQYLVKWEDYPVQRSTWTPENEIGQAAQVLIRDFEKAASKEGMDISDKSQLILLQEAREGGWGYYTFPS